MRVAISPALHPLKVWLSDSVGGHGHHTQFRQGYELSLVTDVGLEGLGEASPLPRFSAETLAEVETELSSLVPFQVDLPEHPTLFRSWLEQRSAERHWSSASARFAFEGALLDLCSKYFRLSAASLIGQMLSREISRDGLALSKLLTGIDPQALCAAADRAVFRGYRTLKVKLGSFENFQQDMVGLDQLRKHFGPELRLRLDPNQGWPIAEVPQILELLSRLSPELVEEPVAANDLARLDWSPVPIALDESLRRDGVLERISPHVARLNIRAIVLKPALLGLFRSLNLAEQATRLGLKVIVTHLFDGPIAHATAASVALAVGSPDIAHGLAPHPGLSLCPQRLVLGLGEGRLTPTDQPGLPISGTASC